MALGRRVMLEFARALGTAGLVLVLGAAWSAWADGLAFTDNVPRVLTYEGQLERDGAPVTATGTDALWMRFRVYDADAPEVVIYEEDERVDVYGGRFSVQLGPTDRTGNVFDQMIGRADDLLLRIVLLGDPSVPGDDVALANAQRLTPTPYSLWAARATDFVVFNQLTALGNASVGGEFSASGRVTLAGNTSIGGTLSSTGSLLTVEDPLRVNGGLTVQGSIDSPGTVLTVEDSLRVNGTLTVTGNVESSGSTVTVNDGLTVVGAVAGSTHLTLNDRVLVSEDLVLSVGDTPATGLRFPDNAGGGAGDSAWLRYYREGSGEDMKLQLGVGNDGNDDLELYQGGAARLRIADGATSVVSGYFRLPSYVTAPVPCSASTVGGMYFDTSVGSFDLPCVCIFGTSGYRWVPTDNWGSNCD